MRLLDRRLLLASVLVLAGCTSTMTVTEQRLVRCPATAPDLECEKDAPPREGFVSEWFIELSLWAACYKEEADAWRESWEECAD